MAINTVSLSSLANLVREWALRSGHSVVVKGRVWGFDGTSDIYLKCTLCRANRSFPIDTSTPTPEMELRKLETNIALWLSGHDCVDLPVTHKTTIEKPVEKPVEPNKPAIVAPRKPRSLNLE